MMRVFALSAVLIALVASTVAADSARTYAVYFDCTSGRETAVRILNPDAAPVEYTLSFHEPLGATLGETAGSLGPYQETSLSVRELLANDWESLVCPDPENERQHIQPSLELCRGGLAFVEATGSLVLEVSFADGNRAPVSLTIDQAVEIGQPHAYHFYAVPFTERDTHTRLSVLNPQPHTSSVTISLYDPAGGLVGMGSAATRSLGASTFDVADLLVERRETAGIIEIYAPFPLAICVEYLDVEGTLLRATHTATLLNFLD